MDVDDQNDDEMIVFVVEDDDDGTNQFEISEGPEPETPIKLEPIQDFGYINYTEDVKEILDTVAERKELIEIQPDTEVLNEELSQEEYLEEEFSIDIVDTKITETNCRQKKHSLRKTHHKYLLEEDVEFKDSYVSTKSKKRKNVSVKNKKRKKNLPTTKLAPKEVKDVKKEENQAPVMDEEVFYEVEFLDENIMTFPKNPDSGEDNFEIECLDDLPNKAKRKIKKTPKKTKIKKELDEPSINNEDELNIKREEDDEYRPEGDDSEDSEDSMEEEYSPSKRPSRSSRRPPQDAAVKPIKSFIAELRKNQPVFKENKEKLIEYLVEYMRKRLPPPPPPDYYHLDEDNLYCCSYCEKKKSTEAAAGRHYQAAHGPRYLVCLACGSGFRSTVILYKHEKRCTGPYADIQLRARGVFLGRKGRGRPYLTNTKFIPKEPPPGKPVKPEPEIPVEKKKYYCTECPAYFTRDYLLEEHTYKHTGYRAFQCPDCPAAYVSRYQLTKHSKKHSNMQYICDHCGKVFKLKTTLSSHLDTHLPRPRFGCGRCGRRYAKRDAVRVHIMRDHMKMPKPAACPVCPKRFSRMSNVKVHMKRDHGLNLLTKRAIAQFGPYMKVEDFKGAKIVFKTEKDNEVGDISPNEEDILRSSKIE